MRKQLKVKGIDGTHIRTCLRAKICRTGLTNINTEAWIKVAKSQKTPLKLASFLVLPNRKVIEQQNEAFARTKFCEEVEREMRNNGDVGEAQFCRLVREWEEVEDKPGISAHERVMRVLNLRTWLLDEVDISISPLRECTSREFQKLIYNPYFATLKVTYRNLLKGVILLESI